MTSPFTPAQLNNLIGFVRRVPLTGTEAFAYCEIYAVLTNLQEKQGGGEPKMPAPPTAPPMK